MFDDVAIIKPITQADRMVAPWAVLANVPYFHNQLVQLSTFGAGRSAHMEYNLLVRIKADLVRCKRGEVHLIYVSGASWHLRYCGGCTF